MAANNRWVRPTTAHNTTRNGLSYDTAWGGAGEIPSGLPADTDVWLCDAWSSAAIITIPSHNGTPTQRVRYRGDYPGAECTLAFSNASHYLNLFRSNTDVKGFKLLQAVLLSGTIANIDITDNVVPPTGTIAPIKLQGNTGDNYTDVKIGRNRVTWSSQSQMVASAVQWFVSTSQLSTCTRVDVFENTFVNVLCPRSVIQFRSQTDSNAATRMQDMRVWGNKFYYCGGTMIDYNSPGNPAAADTSAGLLVWGNEDYDSVESSTVLGGFLGLWGFANSTTQGFGKNRVWKNRAYRIVGPTGFFDGFYGSYIVEDNYGEDISSNGADGNAILWDFSCHDCIARRNIFRNVRGNNDGRINSGVGIMVLNDCTNIYNYANVFDGVHVGLFYGASGASSTGISAHNTFINLNGEAVHMHASATLVNGQAARNNLFQGSGVKVNNLSAAWANENGNHFYGFSGANVNHTHGTDSVIDAAGTLVTAGLNLVSLRPQAGSPLIGTAKFAGHFSDATGKPFRLPASVGAYEDRRIKARKSR